MVAPDTAHGWGVPASAGRRWALCGPSSRAPVYLRFVEGDAVPAYRPVRTFGWAAVELCVQDVEQVHVALAGSPFTVIGQPSPIGGLPTIRPMQVRGPDEEIVYLTQILTDDPAEGLPSPGSLVDHLFILVLACRDRPAIAQWFAEKLGLDVSEPMSIRYSMINKAFGLSPESKHELATAQADGRIILEFDQYPDAATIRPQHVGHLPPGVAIGTLLHPHLNQLNLDWIAPPVPREGALYGGRTTGTVRTPEGALLELIEG